MKNYEKNIREYSVKNFLLIYVKKLYITSDNKNLGYYVIIMISGKTCEIKN